MFLALLAIICVGALLRAASEGRKREQSGMCPKCRYDLEGLPDPVQCPECGATGDQLLVTRLAFRYSRRTLRYGLVAMLAPLLGWMVAPLTWLLLYWWSGQSLRTAWYMIGRDEFTESIGLTASSFVAAFVIGIRRVRGGQLPSGFLWMLEAVALVMTCSVTALGWWMDSSYWSGNDLLTLATAWCGTVAVLLAWLSMAIKAAIKRRQVAQRDGIQSA